MYKGADALVKERRRENESYKILCTKKRKQLCAIIPLSFNSAIVAMSSGLSSLCYLSEADWIDRYRLSLIVDIEVWSQGDPMGHSYTLQIPNFFLDRPFGFSVHRDTLFCPSRLFRFSTYRVYRFFFVFIPNFFPNPFGLPECPYFFLGHSTYWVFTYT